MTHVANTKPGSPKSQKKEAVRIAEAMGVLPIEVMLEAMNYHVLRARRELRRKDEFDEVTGEVLGEDGVNHNLVTLCYANAVNCARDAAPYVHPKLVPRREDVDDPNTTAQRILAAMAEIEQAGGYAPSPDESVEAANRGPNLENDLSRHTVN